MSDEYIELTKHAKEIQDVADEISGRFLNLCTFEDSVLWKLDAQALIRLLEQFRTEFTDYRIRQEAALAQAVVMRSAQSFLKRSFVSKEEKQYKENFESANKTIASVDQAIEDLSDLIERTPTSKTEQKRLTQELRQAKQELTIEKRSVNESMRQIRAASRQRTASWAGVRGKGVVGSIARYDRAHTTRQKEGALSPYEEAKASIERQLIEVERRITWTSRFTGVEPEQISNVLRCAYCGRRVEPYQVCSGCGSDRTMLDTQ